MAIIGAQKWAIILCKFRGQTDVPVTAAFCRKFFLTPGTNGLFDYWKDISYGKLTLQGSKVWGPYNLSYSLEEANDSADKQRIESHKDPEKRIGLRVFRIQDVVNDLADRIDYSDVRGVIVIFNVNLDAGAAWTRVPLKNGKTRSVPAVCLDPNSFVPDTLGHLSEHESGHMLGLPHAQRLGAKEEYARRGDTSDRWAYTDGWSVMGGIRDDGSNKDCRFEIDNAELLRTRSGPGLIAKSVRDLGWMEASRVTVYRAQTQHAVTLAALNHPEAPGALMVETTRTHAGLSPYSVELRWKDGWDAGIPRHAFLVHKIDPNGATHLVPRSPTQHDWVPGDRFESVADGIGVDFESIDARTYSGRIRLTRVVGESANRLVAGGWGMIALQRGTGAPFRYLGRPGQWLRVGDPAAQFAISGNALFGLSADRQKIWRYTGKKDLWVHIGESADALIAGGWGLIALQRGTGIPYRYLGKPGKWAQVGGSAAQFAISGNALFGLASDRKKIWRYTGRGPLWEHVGESADALVAGGWGLIALQRGTGIPFRFLGRAGTWTQVGGPAAQFAISNNALYGLASDRKKIWRYQGREQLWEQVGGAAHSIAAGGNSLFSLSPNRSSITRH